MDNKHIHLKINQILEYFNQKLKENGLIGYDANKKSIPDFHIKKMADAVLLSKRSTERTISDTLGDSFRKFFLNLRLEHAAHLLTTTSKEVREIAESAGYIEHASFTKEFKRRFGCPPETYRRNHKDKTIDCTSIIYTMEELPETHLIYSSHIGIYDACSTPEFETLMWNELEQRAIELGIMTNPPAYYGIGFDDSTVRIENHLCRFYACVQVVCPPPKRTLISHLTIPSGKYAKFIHQGSYSQLELFYNRIYQFFASNEFIKLCNEYPLERYQNSPTDTPDTELITELLFPV